MSKQTATTRPRKRVETRKTTGVRQPGQMDRFSRRAIEDTLVSMKTKNSLWNVTPREPFERFGVRLSVRQRGCTSNFRMAGTVSNTVMVRVMLPTPNFVRV